MKRLRILLREAATVVVGVAVSVLLFVLVYSISLTVLGIDASCAEELARYPVAYVDVKADSFLNVRDEPNGDKLYGLPCRADVVILTEEAGWALVTSEERLAEGNNPHGWVCMDYLHKYREYLSINRGPAPGDADPRN